MNSIPRIPTPVNQPVLSYAPGTPERAELKRTLKELSGRQLEIPLVIGGKDVHTGRTVDVVMPHCHRHVLAKARQAGPAELQAAIAAAREAWRDWSAWGFEQRAAVFLKAADLLATRYRPIVNGATMLGQSKTAHQAEIDAACELIDFFRFNVHYAERIYAEQPLSVSGVWNYLDYRPLEGFVYAITPFNFTSIGGNLPTAPAIMGNTVVWKPAATAVLSNYFIMRLLAEAGLPPGVINFVPGPSVQVSERVLADRMLEMLAEVKVGDPVDFRNFMGAVIDRKAFDKIKAYIDAAKRASGVKVVFGGGADDTDGYFIDPTILEAQDPTYRTMCEEIFGPVLSVHGYPAARWAETLRLVDDTSPYALTGAIFAQDRRAVEEAKDALRFAAGNFYVNDKPTGAVVGQQPFGGARASGTNDKAGSLLNLIRWVSPRAVKENFVPPRTFSYPFMAEA